MKNGGMTGLDIQMGDRLADVLTVLVGLSLAIDFVECEMLGFDLFIISLVVLGDLKTLLEVYFF